MRLYRGQAKSIAREICERLVAEEAADITVEAKQDAEGDLESILVSYIKTEQEINNEARDQLRERGQGNDAFMRTKRRLAKDRGFAVGDEAVDWLVTQLLEMILYTGNIEEVYAEDRDLRRIINKVLQAHASVDSELDKEARTKIKNLQEGSTNWEIEYEKAMQALRRQKGLT